MKSAGSAVWWALRSTTAVVDLAAAWDEHGIHEVPLPAAHGFEYSAEALSEWLAGPILFAVWGLSLRERGGFYFVPREQEYNWARVETTLAAFGHAFYRLTVARDAVLGEALLDAAAREALGTLARTRADRQALGARGRVAHLHTLEEARKKLRRYAALCRAATPVEIEARFDEVATAIAARGD